MKTNRKEFLTKTIFGASGGVAVPFLNLDKVHMGNERKVTKNKIGVPSYSFWQFYGPKEGIPIPKSSNSQCEAFRGDGEESYFYYN